MMCLHSTVLLIAILMVASARGGNDHYRLFVVDKHATSSKKAKTSMGTSASSSKAFKSKKHIALTNSSKAFKVSKKNSSHSSKAFKASKSYYHSDTPTEYATSKPTVGSASTPVTSSPATTPPTAGSTVSPSTADSSVCSPLPDHSSPVPCQPTYGECITNLLDLDKVTRSMNDNDVISICGNIVTLKTIRIEASNVIFCCGSSSSTPCMLTSGFTHQILHVTGENFTLSGIDFKGGQGDMNLPGGGNLAIRANGHHLIQDCNFYEGSAPSYKMPAPNVGYASGCGDNAYVETNHSLSVRRSSFHAGGLCVYDATDLEIAFTSFVSTPDSGLYTHWQGPRYTLPNQNGMNIMIYNSTFEGNSEAILASNYGIMPRLHIQQTSFVDNIQGVSVCCGYDDVTLCGNSGVSGDDSWCGQSIHIWGSNDTELCIPFDVGYSSSSSIKYDVPSLLPTPTTDHPTDTTYPPNTTISGQSCSAPQILTIPSVLFDQSLSNIKSTTGDNPASVCTDRFDFKNATVAWYEVTAEENTCFCVRLSSYDRPFIIGVLLAANDGCKNTTCINESDFTSQSIAWRTSPSTKYKIAVSVMSGGAPDTDGSYLLNVVDSGTDACPEMFGSSKLIPFGCPMTQCEKATSERNCRLFDYCNWCSDESDNMSSGQCVSRNYAEAQGGNVCK